MTNTAPDIETARTLGREIEWIIGCDVITDDMFSRVSHGVCLDGACIGISARVDAARLGHEARVRGIPG